MSDVFTPAERSAVMRRVKGTAHARRLLRNLDPEAGDALARTLGAEIAKLHKITPANAPAALGFLPKEGADLIARVSAIFNDYDALVMPTLPIVAPAIAEFESDEVYARLNILSLRNPTVANFLDLCAISLPVHRPGDAPVGLMLVGKHGEDAKLFRIAKAVETLFK